MLHQLLSIADKNVNGAETTAGAYLNFGNITSFRLLPSHFFFSTSTLLPAPVVD
jgi:hypothetical protein